MREISPKVYLLSTLLSTDKLIDWLGKKADEQGREMDDIEDEFSAEYGWHEGYMECCNELISKIKKGEFEDEVK